MKPLYSLLKLRCCAACEAGVTVRQADTEASPDRNTRRSTMQKKKKKAAKKKM